MSWRSNIPIKSMCRDVTQLSWDLFKISRCCVTDGSTMLLNIIPYPFKTFVFLKTWKENVHRTWVTYKILGNSLMRNQLSFHWMVLGISNKVIYLKFEQTSCNWENRGRGTNVSNSLSCFLGLFYFCISGTVLFCLILGKIGIPRLKAIVLCSLLGLL